MDRSRILTVCLVLTAAPSLLADSPPRRTRLPAVVMLRTRQGPVEVRCSHLAVKTWRGLELHRGDTVQVGSRGWAAVSVQTTGASFLLDGGSKVKIESAGIRRISGPVPRRGLPLTRGRAQPAPPGETAPPPVATPKEP